MAAPDYQTLMLPALQALSDGVEAPISEVRARVAAAEHLTTQDLKEMLPSKRQSVFANRVGWAMSYMEHAGLVERVRRAVYRVTAEGERLLQQKPPRIDLSVLRTYPAFLAWSTARTQPAKNTAEPLTEPVDTPEEELEAVIQQLRRTLELDVLDRVRKATPEFLEQVIIDLLIAMGYGGGNAAMGQVTGGSGDGGIDGTIREDTLGLDEVYVQAKKYAEGNTVGESDLRNFAGAIDAAGTTKGVFVTTSDFTRSARNYMARSPKRIVLIDGEELARLMVAHDIGVRTRISHQIKRIDEDYFTQDAP
jgi:restriction system protein